MKQKTATTLGLDIGLASVGWSLIETQTGLPTKIVHAGVRIFPMGMELDDKGRGTSRSVERREARLRRRQLDRRAMRKAHVRSLLFKHNLAPDRKTDTEGWRKFEAFNPYELRAKGIDQALTPYELGRVLFHLAQRRGFQSNRKAPLKKDEKPGELKKATDSLMTDIQASSCRTLGEFFFKLDPHQRRIRGNYTLRRWYIDEFNLIWEKQTSIDPRRYTDKLRKLLYDAIFDQRPLKVKESTVGTCDLERGKRRCRVAHLDAQRFRLLQQMNNLRIEEEIGKERLLTKDERNKLIKELEVVEKLKFTTARKLLRIKNKFNLERGGAEILNGDVTTARIRSLMGDMWDELDQVEREQFINDIQSIESPEVLKRRLMQRWELNEPIAESISEIPMEDGHLAHSLAAIKKILPLMEAGAPYMTALMEAYPENAKWKAVNEVPKFPNLRNPLVQRSLAETRRVVNAVVKRYGKPDMIRVELARDLKKAAKERESEWTRMRAREKERSNARESIKRLKEYHIANPRASDIEKWLLFQECGGICPYTGKAISHASLFGDHPQFDVEHIIPFSRSLDDSFANKTLCHADYNRNFKKNKTPFEATGNTNNWTDILKRVGMFTGDYKDTKLRRFVMEKVADEDGFLDEFSQRDLAITRYATKAAYNALARLYDPDEAKKRVQATQGKATSYLRRAWRLNDILGLANEKTREDHRQHTIDATVVALTTPTTIKSLANSAIIGRAGAFDPIPHPWEGFKEDLQSLIAGITTSHRVDKRTNGPLHKETYYGIITDPSDLKTNRAVVRKEIATLSEKDITGDDIIDPAVRDAVRSRLKEIGSSDPAKAFKERDQHPFMIAKDGRKIPIHKVRMFQSCDPITIEAEPGKRNVVLGNNHHVEFFSIKDKKGNSTLKSVVVSQLDTLKRVAQAKREGKSSQIVRQIDESGNKLSFSLAIGEMAEIDWKGQRVRCVVQKLSEQYYVFRPTSDARKVKDIPTEEVIRIRSDSALFASNLQKLICDPLGFTFRTRD